MNNKGKLWEIEAANYLRKHKYKLVDVNYTTRFGEIDLIVQNKKYLCFVEVKQRNIDSIALPREFVTYSKQQKIIASAKMYLMQNKTDLQPRFDVIEIYTDNNKIKSIKRQKPERFSIFGNSLWFSFENFFLNLFFFESIIFLFIESITF